LNASNHALVADTAPGMGARLRDFGGALNAAATSFTVAACAGAIVFAPLGAQFLPNGVVAALFATVVGGTLAALLSTSPAMLSCPRAASCIVLAGFVAALHRAAPQLSPGSVIALTGFVTFLAGGIQLLAGALKVGRLVRFVPFPVVSGFTHGIAATLFLAFLPLFLGMADVPRLAWPDIARFHPWAIPVGVASLVTVIAAVRISPRLPAIFLGMIAGAIVAGFVQFAMPGIDTGAAIRPADVPPLHSPFLEGSSWLAAFRDAGIARLVFSFAVALAAVASIDSVIAAVALETRYGAPTQPDRDLLAQGLGNLVSGALGGVAITISGVSGQAALEHGATRRIVPVLAAAFIAIIGLAGAAWLPSLPLAVMAGLMLYVSLRIADPWGLALVKSAFANRGRLDANTTESLAVYLLVALAILTLDVVAALAVGLIVSSFVFVRTINRHVLRRVVTGPAVRSRRQYPPAVVPALDKALEGVAVIELDGPLFFGTADRISMEVEGLAHSVRFVVIDLHRAQAVDATAQAVLTRTRARLAAAGRLLLVAGRPHGLSGLSPALEGAFPDRDRAVEWIEQQLVDEMGLAPDDMTMAPGEVAARLGLSEDEGRHLLAVAAVREFRAGDYVFREGDAGKDLCYVLAGRVSILLEVGGRPSRRAVTYLPGNSFGDVAFLDGQPRSASAVCDVQSRLLLIDREAVEALARDRPALVARIYAALALDVAGRLRGVDRLLREEIGG
jgi:SulP family sulfate permease